MNPKTKYYKRKFDERYFDISYRARSDKRTPEYAEWEEVTDMTKKQLVLQVIIEGLCVMGLIAAIICLPGQHYYAAGIFVSGGFVLALWAELRRRKWE